MNKEQHIAIRDKMLELGYSPEATPLTAVELSNLQGKLDALKAIEVTTKVVDGNGNEVPVGTEGITVPRLKKVEYSDVISYLTYAEKIVPLLASSLPSAIELKFLADSNKMNRFDLSQPNVAASVNRLMTALLTDGLIDANDVQAITEMAHE
jgi:hypothetical protein